MLVNKLTVFSRTILFSNSKTTPVRVLFLLKSKLNTLVIYRNFFNVNPLYFKTKRSVDSGGDLTELVQNLFGCSRKKAETLIELNYEFLSNVKHDNLHETFSILINNNVLVSSIEEQFWLLSLEKDSLTTRLKLLDVWNFKNPNNGLCILKLPYSRLLKLTQKTKLELLLNKGMNRITYFSSHVKCDEKLASKLFMKYSFMMSIKLETMKQLLEIIKDQGVLTEDLLSDLWVFRYRLDFVKARVKLLDEIGAKQKCKVIKPWMLRCSEQTFNRYFELREENIAALGSYSNLRELLSKELKLSSNEVNEMILKHPSLAKLSYCKAKDMIDFLKTEGVSSSMIYHVPRVLCHKQATLAARLTELKKINPHSINLQILCRNKKDFVAIVNKMSLP